MIVLDGVTFLATILMPQRKSLFLRQKRKYCPIKRELKEATKKIIQSTGTKLYLPREEEQLKVEERSPPF